MVSKVNQAMKRAAGEDWMADRTKPDTQTLAKQPRFRSLPNLSPAPPFTLNTLILIKYKKGVPAFWNGDTRNHLPADRIPVRQNNNNALTPRALLSKGNLKTAKKLMEAVTRVYHFAAADLSMSSNKRLVPIISHYLKPLWSFVGGQHRSNAIIKAFLSKINTRMHESAEGLLLNHVGGSTDRDLIAEVLSTAYGNSVDIFNSERALAMANAYVSAYKKYMETVPMHNTCAKSSQKLRRKAINMALANFRADEKNLIKANKVRLYHRFGCHDRQSSGATYSRRNDPLVEESVDFAADGFSDHGEMEPIIRSSSGTEEDLEH